MRLLYFLTRKTIIFTLLFFISSSRSYSQNRDYFYLDIGAGEQLSKRKIKGSQYNSFVTSPIPKLFLAIGFENKINNRYAILVNLNMNQSKTETSFNYTNNSDGGGYKENVWHKDNNTGLGVGIRYVPKFHKDKFSMGAGFNFQKMASMFFSGSKNNTLDSTRLISSFNNYTKRYNSWGYYLSIGYNFGKKKKNEALFEFNSTLNKPVFGTSYFYYKNQFVESSSYKVNMLFIVLKLRRKF